MNNGSKIHKGGWHSEQIQGVQLAFLTRHADSRGSLTEYYVESERPADEKILQWNFVDTQKGAFRGVHVQPWHDDLFVCLGGSAQMGLIDLREGSETFGAQSYFTVEEDSTLVIPAGVAHGFYAVKRLQIVIGVNRQFDLQDELECRYDDPSLHFEIGNEQPILSVRDRDAGTLDCMRRVLQIRQENGPVASQASLEK